MEPKYISLTEFCTYHEIQFSFVHELRDHGLVEIIVIEDNEFIEQEQMRELEKMMRLHYDLEINVQGIDAINNLLTRVSRLQDRVRLLENRLRRFEE